MSSPPKEPPKVFPTPGLLGTRQDEVAPVLGKLIDKSHDRSRPLDKKNHQSQAQPASGPSTAIGVSGSGGQGPSDPSSSTGTGAAGGVPADQPKDSKPKDSA